MLCLVQVIEWFDDKGIALTAKYDLKFILCTFTAT